jgi:hypothetical protein
MGHATARILRIHRLDLNSSTGTAKPLVTCEHDGPGKQCSILYTSAVTVIPRSLLESGGAVRHLIFTKNTG